MEVATAAEQAVLNSRSLPRPRWRKLHLVRFEPQSIDLGLPLEESAHLPCTTSYQPSAYERDPSTICLVAVAWPYCPQASGQWQGREGGRTVPDQLTRITKCASATWLRASCRGCSTPHSMHHTQFSKSMMAVSAKGHPDCNPRGHSDEDWSIGPPDPDHYLTAACVHEAGWRCDMPSRWR